VGGNGFFGRLHHDGSHMRQPIATLAPTACTEMPRLRPPPEPSERQKDLASERRKQLWAAVQEFITKHGGWIVSLPNGTPIRFECRADNLELPVELRRLGYAVRNAGNVERLLPIVETMSQHGRQEKIQREQVGLIPVEIHELNLPI
jgi:hypothetical protein